MKIQMSDISNLQTTVEKIQIQPLSIKTTYKLTKLIKALATENEFYNSKLNELIQTYGARDEDGALKPTKDGNGVQLQQDKIEEAQEKLKDLFMIEVDLPDIQFKIDEFEDVKLTVEEMKPLLPFIEE